MQKLPLILLLVLIVYNTQAQEGKHIVKQGFTVDFFKDNILEPEEWVQFPKSNNPEKWRALIPDAKYAALIQKAESFLDYEWPQPRASVFLDYVENGNRTNYQSITFSRRDALAALVVGELVEGKGRFVTDIVDGIWTICEETFWGVPAHLGYQERGHGLADVTDPVVDLFAAETASMLAWISYLMSEELDNVSPLINERIYIEIDRRILTVIESDPQYRWMGYGRNVTDTTLSYQRRSFLQRRPNNWNPWIASNLLTSILLLENDKNRRAKFVYQVFDFLDNYIDPYPADGGCDEGTGYWGRAAASTFDCFDLMESATNEKFNLFGESLIKKMGEFISKAYIGNGYFLNFADAVSKTSHSPMLIYRYGKAVDSKSMIEMGAFIAQQSEFEHTSPKGYSLLRILPELYYSKDLLTSGVKEPLIQDSWFPDIQVMISRDNNSSSQGLYLAAKAGHNEESHNHNDVGSFLIFNNGHPAIIDVGAATYTKNYSNSWVRQSEYHNLLPLINGNAQQKGRKYTASNVRYSNKNGIVEFAQDFSKAYEEVAGVRKWERIITHKKSTSITISDNYELEEPTKDIMLAMMFASLPDSSHKGELHLTTSDGEVVKIGYDDSIFDLEFEEIKIEDTKISRNWGTVIYRAQFKMKNKVKSGNFEFVISSIN